MSNTRRPWMHHHAVFDITTCKAGAGTKIHQFASVTRGTIIGEDCSIWPFAMLDGPVIGNNCSIASGVAMGAGFQIGNNVFIGPNVTFCNDMWPRIDKEGYDDAALRSGEKFAVIVEDHVSIGAGAVILPGIRIGRGAMIAAGAVVDNNVPSDCLWMRNGMMRGSNVRPNGDTSRRERMVWAS
jgi:UDP-2-acetamido-3-amino-2,3-dideoxy-glucuronate N-acetyltransferase